MSGNRPPARILAVRLAGLGGTLTATPALRALRESFPAATLDALVTPVGAAALAGTGLVDRTRPVDPATWGAEGLARLFAAFRFGRSLRARPYDRVVLFQHLHAPAEARTWAALTLGIGGRRAGLDNGRGWFLQERATDYGYGAIHEVEYWLAVAGAIGARTDDRRLAIGRDPAAENRAEAWLAGSDRPRLVIHPGSGSPGLARRWPIAGFAEVARRVRDVFHTSIVLVGGPEERDLTADLARQIGPGVTDLGGRTDLPTLAATIARSDVLLANASGVAQVGAAVGVPTVAIFGPSNHEAWRPWTATDDGEPEVTASGLLTAPPPATVVRSEIACSPCFFVDRGLGTPEGCPARTCLSQDVTAAQVGQAVSRYLGARKRALRVLSG